MKSLPNLKNLKEPKKAAKCLAIFCALTLGIAAIFYSPSDLSSTTTNDDCALLATGVVAQPGSNCLFSAMDRNGSKVLPLCREIPATSYSIDPSNILSTGTRRVTCSNLSDLQLCPTTPTSADLPGKNCAPLCDGSFSGTGTRSVDYAIHNRDCIRFCDALEADVVAAGISAQPNINCVDRKCHQLARGEVPVLNGVTTNCSLMPCNLLTKNELIDVAGKIYNDVEVLHRTAGKYCDGNYDINGKTLKCYEFNKDQLLYVTKGHMCKVHNCPAPCPNYNSPLDVNNDGLIDAYDNNDTLNVTDRDKNPLTPVDATYVANYKTSINNGAELSSSSYCSPIYCRPIITKQFRCVDGSGSVTGDGSKDIFRNSSCDSTGTGATCSNNLCFQTIDCNESANNSKPECFQSPDGQIGSTADFVNSEFYRPKPLKKSTRIQGSIRIMEDMNGGYPNGELCYTKGQMENRSDNFDDSRGSTSEDGQWGLDMTTRIPMPAPIPDIVIPIGWFHSSLLPDETRSPRACNVPNSGDRGTGYYYLCYGDGKLAQLYAKVADHTAFHKGYVQTNFTEGDGTHKLNVCLRFRNSLRPDDGTSETCGSRQCAINCLFGVCDSQNCGQDRCVELEVSDSNPNECEMRSAIAEGNLGKKCMGTFDVKPGLNTEGLRIRIQRYGTRKICSFLDARGQTAHDTVEDLDLFIKGSEKLSDGSCVNGSKNSSGNCSGYSNYTNPASAEMWRTIKFGDSGNIPYIQNNQPAGQLPGYYDKNGQFFAEQECIYISLRTAPARIYNLANITNSVKLFTPPIYILNALVKAGSGSPAPRNFGEAFGVTDFNYPAVQVNFGNTTQEISLGASGTELVTGYGDSRIITTLTTTVNGIDYLVDVFARKEFNESTKKPTFCLYRKVINTANVEVRPERIGCVDRKLPALNDTINKQKTVIYLDPSSTFSSSKIVLRFLGSYGANGIDNNCLAGSDDVCSAEIKFENINSDIPTCNSAVVDPTDPTTISPEMYNLCAKRDECSQLNVECIQNEIALQAAKVARQGIESFLAVRKRCNEILLPMCNARKGISAPTGDVVNPNPTNVPESPTAYGWFNEICFVSGDKADGFSSHLKQVIAYKTSAQGIKGKCLTHEGRTACPNGGKAPNCNCAAAIDGVAIDLATQEIRTQTPREAGLCVDMPIPQTCPAIDYNPTSTIPSDPEYVYTSLNQASYGSGQSSISGVVHISHQTRSQASASSHAEFPLTVIGSVDVEGSCGGFWKNSISPSTGIASAPTRTCVNTNGNASWDSVVKNACSRYSCEARLTTGALSEATNASYQGGYASSETGEGKGSGDGFATWPSYLKTNDFPEDVAALACIPGFKKIGANSIAGTPIRTYETKISGYSGGNSPVRKCNQIGTWQNPTNACERIKCPAITPTPATKLSSTFTTADWVRWYDAGGATFTQTDASRSTAAGIVAIGTCNNDIGFFNLGEAPTRRCDYLGNWGPVVNPCTTRCEAITADFASGSNNGNATWSEAIIPSGKTEEEGAFGNCLNGFAPYPYPPLKNKYGIPYDLARGSITNYDISGVTTIAGNANYESSIPLDVSLDGTRPERIPGNPKKLCRALSFDGVVTNTWAAANSSCIAGCPGASQDPRVGVGVTQHDSTDGKKTIKWANGATFGTWYFVASGSPETSVANIPNFTGENAANFTKDRTNKVFILARFCGDGIHHGSVEGKWNDPIPQCATNGSAPNVGMIADSNAFYNTSSPHSGASQVNSRTIDVNDSTLATTNSCRTDGNYFKTDSDTTPVNISSYKCVYKSGNNIDEVYFDKVAGEPCKIYCPAPAVGEPFGNSKYDSGASTYTKVGDKISLICKDTTFGKAPDSDTSTSDNNCGRANIWRTDLSPQVTCLNTGLFGTIERDCTKCGSCNFALGNVTISGDTLIKDTSDLNCDADTNKTRDRVCNFDAAWMKNPPTSAGNCQLMATATCTFESRIVESGSSITCNGRDTEDATDCRSKTMNASITMRCTDGTATVTSLTK